MRVVTLGLLALLVLVHGALWLGRGGVPRVIDLSGRLAEQRSVNELARSRNDRLVAELRDLREGLEIVEEKARFELGMVKADEILVQIAPAKR